MIAGRSGSQKSGLALFLVEQMGLPTLYFSGDMTPFEATSRLVAMHASETVNEIERELEAGNGWKYDALLSGSKVGFSFGQPITWHGIQANLDAFVELHNEFPKVIVIDNLMDMAGGESDYAAQQQAMQDLTSLSRDTGATLIVLHHASEKGDGVDLSLPPGRRAIKNGLTEKPQLILTVALVETFSGQELRVAAVKQRSGRSDPSGRTYARLKAAPEYTRFYSGEHS